ncbi:MAG: NUDIX hydrolase [Candidatus Bathyarchaeia archaeon]
MEERVISSKTYYEGRLLKFKVDEVQIQGKEYARAVVDHPGSVAVVPFIDSSRILMIKQYRHPVRETILEIPAGTLEKNEKPHTCARRELEEETGYTPGRLRRIGSLYLAPG